MQEVCQLIDDALDGKLYYDALAEKIQSLGVETIALDALRGIHTCYMKDAQIFDHPLLREHVYAVAPTFSKEGIAAALAKFDSQEFTARQFHEALADAGVAYARCTYGAKRAVYLGLNSEVYIEQW
jgi:uncharacterized protein YbcV (DUF1398 family)